MGKNTYKFKFSIVMSIYDTEEWLREAVDSIIAQDIGFEQNVQIIMVNDGSPDDSESICLEYREKYPNNIVYIKKENGGLASARNVGLKYVEGEYVNFFDPDDILSTETLRMAGDYFTNNYDDIDLVAIKLMFFDAKTGPHALNYKFEKDAIINLEEQYDFPQLSAASAFIKVSAIGDLRFDDSLRSSEDTKFIPQILCNKMKYGVLSKPTYHYRQRLSATSIMDNRSKTDYWFMTVIPSVFMFLIDFSLNRYGHVPKFIQYTVLYGIAGDLMGKTNSSSVLTQEQVSEYKTMLGKLIDYIDDDVIMKERYLRRTHKIYLLGKKRKENSLAKLYAEDGLLKYRGEPVHKLTRFTVNIELISVHENKITLEGFSNGIETRDTKVCFASSDRVYLAEYVDDVPKTTYFINEPIYVKHRFKVTIPLKEINSIKAFILENEDKRYYVKFDYRKNTRLTGYRGYAYRSISNYLVLPLEKELIVRRKQIHRLIWREYKRCLSIAKSGKPAMVLLRLASRIAGMVYRKPIWVISDRLVCGRDNGEALFRYISSLDTKQIDVYFAVNRSSEDYRRLKKYGKVVDRQGIKYKLLFILSDKIISSHFDDFVTSLLEDDEYLSDLYKFDYVFLQHGVTINDMSVSLNKYRRNIKLLITTAKPEYKAFLNNKYGYSKTEVKLTGFPRFDLLDNSPRGKVIIAPTWRKHIITQPKQGTDIREYDRSFKSTDYYKFYADMLTDKSLLKYLKKYNMTAEFYVHPNLSMQSADFETEDSSVKVRRMPYDYATALTEGNLLITDYSSVAFDFSYLRKPVIYTQFDNKVFFGAHYNPGYFSYEKNGFGPVAYTYEETIHQIIEAIKGESGISAKYKKRVDDFYKFSDKSNSPRVYEAINDML